MTNLPENFDNFSSPAEDKSFVLPDAVEMMRRLLEVSDEKELICGLYVPLIMVHSSVWFPGGIINLIEETITKNFDAEMRTIALDKVTDILAVLVEERLVDETLKIWKQHRKVINQRNTL